MIAKQFTPNPSFHCCLFALADNHSTNALRVAQSCKDGLLDKPLTAAFCTKDRLRLSFPHNEQTNVVPLRKVIVFGQKVVTVLVEDTQCTNRHGLISFICSKALHYALWIPSREGYLFYVCQA